MATKKKFPVCPIGNSELVPRAGNPLQSIGNSIKIFLDTVLNGTQLWEDNRIGNCLKNKKLPLLIIGRMVKFSSIYLFKVRKFICLKFLVTTQFFDNFGMEIKIGLLFIRASENVKPQIWLEFFFKFSIFKLSFNVSWILIVMFSKLSLQG